MATVPRRLGASRRRWSKEEYYKLGELGFFQGQRIELIEGELMVLSPQGPLHFHEVDRVFRVLYRVFATGYWTRAQGPVDLGQTTEPEPDVSVVPGSSANCVQAHPTKAALIVEVSDSTVDYDTTDKASLYAAAQIEDYWVVNLPGNRLEIRRRPIPDGSARHGWRYADVGIHSAGDIVSPLAVPNAQVRVADLLP